MTMSSAGLHSVHIAVAKVELPVDLALSSSWSGTLQLCIGGTGR